MDTNRLRQFRTLVETGHLRKAAKILGISHSGLSKSIKILEKNLGYRVILPQGRGVVISDAGRVLYDRSTPLMKELDALSRPAERFPGNTNSHKPLRIGSFEVFTSMFMGELAAEFFPERMMEIHELTPSRLEEALLLNRIDLGITYEPIARPGIHFEQVTRVAMGLYAIKALSKMENVPFAVPAEPLEGPPTGVRGRDAWPEAHHPRLVRYRVDSMTTGLELTRQGLCAIYIPQFVAQLHNRFARPEHHLQKIDLGKGFPEINREVFIVTRESSEETSEVRTIARALRKLTRV